MAPCSASRSFADLTRNTRCSLQSPNSIPFNVRILQRRNYSSILTLDDAPKRPCSRGVSAVKCAISSLTSRKIRVLAEQFSSHALVEFEP